MSFELFHPQLSPGALVAAENMLFSLDSVLLPIGSGVELSRKHEHEP